jgi:hypothetical protein
LPRPNFAIKAAADDGIDHLRKRGIEGSDFTRFLAQDGAHHVGSGLAIEGAADT